MVNHRILDAPNSLVDSNEMSVETGIVLSRGLNMRLSSFSLYTSYD